LFNRWFSISRCEFLELFDRIREHATLIGIRTGSSPKIKRPKALEYARSEGIHQVIERRGIAQFAEVMTERVLPFIM
jgi:hypothetical protein